MGTAFGMERITMDTGMGVPELAAIVFVLLLLFAWLVATITER